MTIRGSGNLGTPHPDNTQAIVGESGIPVRQDLDGTQIQRLGVAGSDADWGPDTETIPANGEVKIATPDGVGGTRSSAGVLRSNDDATFSVVYVWASENDNVDSIAAAEASDTAVVERPPGSQKDTEVVIEDVTTKGDDAIVFAEDTSGADNEVEYTLNFH